MLAACVADAGGWPVSSAAATSGSELVAAFGAELGRRRAAPTS